MQIDKIRRPGGARAATVTILAGLVGGCVGPSIPAPVYYGNAGETAAFTPMPAPLPSLQVIVKRGQTLDGYAYTYHLPKSAIIAANRLRPPYRLEAGQRLIIPNRHGSVQQAMIPPPAPTTRSWSPSPMPPPQQAAIPQPPRTPETVTLPPPASRPPQTIFPAPSAATPQPTPPVQMAPASVAPSLQPPTPPLSGAKNQPEIIPLDGPPSAKEADAAPPNPAILSPPQQSPVLQTVGPVSPAPVGSSQTSAEPAPGGRFPWPVRGHILAAYGNAPGGGHNDGINIAAPLGTPVRAIDGGTVVYSGNEVKGYGNIVLIRHANGWISAYAHLSDVAVRPGDAISAGEVIAKVGNSGGVAEPQLHFELRRGKKPVNPTEFLAPAPSAQGAGNGAG
ncbi:MAG TPA: peptidoglycan DD-metalloendopeptidase family protein [Stellaceae bacterium]|nr:peptidoglycan DD-metalloendopeptidase family protein [Stellaceae bacterium]